MFRIPCQRLGQHIQALIFLRRDIPFLPGQQGQRLGQLVKRQAVNVNPAEYPVMGLPQNPVRDAFHRREINDQCRSSFSRSWFLLIILRNPAIENRQSVSHWGRFCVTHFTAG